MEKQGDNMNLTTKTLKRRIATLEVCFQSVENRHQTAFPEYPFAKAIDIEKDSSGVVRRLYHTIKKKAHREELFELLGYPDIDLTQRWISYWTLQAEDTNDTVHYAVLLDRFQQLKKRALLYTTLSEELIDDQEDEQAEEGATLKI
jgi:hypothetical protein